MINSLNENMRKRQDISEFPISGATLWRWVREGKLKSYKVGEKTTVFKRSELEALFNCEK